MTTHAVCVALALERTTECPRVLRAMRMAKRLRPEAERDELHSLAAACLEEQEERRGEAA